MAETREEQYLTSILSGQSAPSPITREEQYLAYLAGSFDKYPEPITRKEELLYEICKNGGGSGGSGGDSSAWDGKIYTIANDDVSIGSNSFKYIPNLEEVVISTCNSLDSYAFFGCGSLKHVAINNGYNGANVGSGDYSGEYIFRACRSLESASLNGSKFGRYMFYECDNLIRVELTNLKNNTGYPINISSYMFSQCQKLTTVEGSGGTLRAESIGEGAFLDCISLEKITIYRCKQIGAHAFARCSSLKAVILPSEEVCAIDLSAATDTPLLTGEGHIYVPTSMYESYRTAYETAINELMPGFFDILFRKIEDYPEITG